MVNDFSTSITCSDHHDDSQADVDSNTSIVQSTNDTERHSGLFLMRVTDQLGLSHAGVDKLCSATQWYLDIIGDSVMNKVNTHLHQFGITDPSLLAEISKACHPQEVFGKLSSRYYREKYYENNFHYVVIIYNLIYTIKLL